MIEQLEQLDQKLFIWLNSFHSDFWDTIMWHISGKFEWIPIYLLLLILILRKYKRHSWILIMGGVLVVVMADQISVKLFKEIFERWRPCHHLDIKNTVHIVNEKCGGRFGFVSSHATNSFAIATYLGAFLNRKLFWILFSWAAIISYSRIYLGVHYPADVIGGALLGMFIAWLVYRFFYPILTDRIND